VEDVRRALERHAETLDRTTDGAWVSTTGRLLESPFMRKPHVETVRMRKPTPITQQLLDLTVGILFQALRRKHAGSCVQVRQQSESLGDLYVDTTFGLMFRRDVPIPYKPRRTHVTDQWFTLFRELHTFNGSSVARVYFQGIVEFV